MLHAIVGFEIRVASIVGSWKLGQNKSEGDRNGMIDGLEASDERRLPSWCAVMERNRKRGGSIRPVVDDGWACIN